MNSSMKHGILFLIVGMIVVGASLTQAASGAFRITIEAAFPYFFPKAAAVSMGTPIRWENPTATHHTITHNGCLMGRGCAFDSGVISPGEMFEVSNLRPGKYPYHCTLHPIMHGMLVVTNNRESLQSRQL